MNLYRGSIIELLQEATNNSKTNTEHVLCIFLNGNITKYFYFKGMYNVGSWRKASVVKNAY